MSLQEDIDNLIVAIGDKYYCGGPVHIILDDCNVDSKSIKWCMENSIPEEVDIVVRLCSQKLCELLLPLDLRKRVKLLKIDEDPELMEHLLEKEEQGMCLEQNVDKVTLKNLIEARNVAKKEYEKALKILKPSKDKYHHLENAIEEEFVKQKLYIPIDKLPEYLGDQEFADIQIVYEDGETEYLSHEYDISYETRKWTKDGYIPGRMLVSAVADDGYSFKRDIDEDRIVGFYDLELANNVRVKETFKEEIIRKVLDGTT